MSEENTSARFVAKWLPTGLGESDWGVSREHAWKSPHEKAVAAALVAADAVDAAIAPFLRDGSPYDRLAVSVALAGALASVTIGSVVDGTSCTKNEREAFVQALYGVIETAADNYLFDEDLYE